MVWDLINTIIAVLSLGVAAALWYRTVASENPVVDLEPAHTTPGRDSLVAHLRVRNPGRHGLILHHMRLRSPPLGDTRVGVLNGRPPHERLYPANLPYDPRAGVPEDAEPLNTLVAAGAEAVVQINLGDLHRPLDAHLHWSKRTPVVFPWRPIRIRRSAKQLRELALAATEEI